MANTILCIVEGAVTEKKIFNNLEKIFFKKIEEETDNFIITAFCTHIYALYKELETDESLDIVELIREKNDKNFKALEGIERDDISQIYLFFDHDAHINFDYSHDEKSDEDSKKILQASTIINGMLEKFNEETESGKLYISYPMVESLKHLNSIEWKECPLKISGDCFCTAVIRENPRYKNRVSKETKVNNVDLFDKSLWLKIIWSHIKKMNCLNSNKYEILSYEDYIKNNQKKIFELQLQEFIQDEKVAIISSFPCFLLDYFGKNLYQNIIESVENKKS